MVSLFRSAVLMLLIGLIVGCGPGSTPVPAPTTPLPERIKTDLQYIVNSGTKGSEMDTIERNIETLAETEPEKAAQLQTEFEKLKAARGPQAPAQAKKMIEML